MKKCLVGLIGILFFCTHTSYAQLPPDHVTTDSLMPTTTPLTDDNALNNSPLQPSSKPMTPEQRNQIRQYMIEQWKKMTPAQRKDFGDKMQKRWNSLTPEQKILVEQRVRQHLDSLTPQEKDLILKNHDELLIEEESQAPAVVKIPELSPPQ